jgi:hypothetical protein
MSSETKSKHQIAGEKAKQTRRRRQAAAKAVVTRQLRGKETPSMLGGEDPVELLLAEWAAEVPSGVCVVCGESMPSSLDEFPVKAKTRRRGMVTLCGSCLMVMGRSDDPVRDLMERRKRRKT